MFSCLPMQLFTAQGTGMNFSFFVFYFSIFGAGDPIQGLAGQTLYH
jgi:hypothetical protein